MSLKDNVLKCVLGCRATSKSYIDHLRKIGIFVGEDVKLFRPMSTTIDVQNPHLLKIGDHVMITGPATILTHDYSWSVIKRKYGCIVGNQKRTTIGSNVFIGWGATILGGSTIGDNCIIGANSVVSGRVESDSVYAGNPAKKIMTLDHFFEKRREKQLEEAVDFVFYYQETYGKIPPIEKLDEYFYLFTDASDDVQVHIFDRRLELMQNYAESKSYIRNSKPLFRSYDQFIDYCNTLKKNGVKRNGS